MSQKPNFFKVKVIFSLIVVIFLVFVTNRIDQKHFTQIQDTISTLFYDRIMAQDYLFKMDRIFQDQAALIKNNGGNTVVDSNAWQAANNEVDMLISLYENTELTKREEATFDKLKSNVEDLRTYENEIFSESNLKAINSAETELDRIRNNITALSEIQVTESNKLKIQAQKSLKDNAFMSNMEIILLVGLGIFFQLAIFFLGRNKALNNQMD